jgi:hypothetical protein
LISASNKFQRIEDRANELTPSHWRATQISDQCLKAPSLDQNLSKNPFVKKQKKDGGKRYFNELATMSSFAKKNDCLQSLVLKIDGGKKVR